MTFGPGEFELSEELEKSFLNKCRNSDNQLFILGLIDSNMVSTLNFSGGHRLRLRHSGDFGISVRKPFWGLGIGSLMIDTLIEWAKDSHIVTKINLRVRTDNQRAIKLYERKGFVIEGTIQKAILLNHEYYDHYWMGIAV